MRTTAIALARLTVALPMVGTLLFAGCDRDSESVEGTWHLVAVGDDALPAEDDVMRIVDGSLEIDGDSLIWRESFVFTGSRPNGLDEPVELRVATAFEWDGALLISRPSIVVIPDDTFQQCVAAGVYRLESGGIHLRQVGWVHEGECGRVPVDPVMPKRTYSRTSNVGW